MLIGARDISYGSSNPYWGLYFEAEEPNAVVNMEFSGSTLVPTSNRQLIVSLDYGKTWQPFDTNGTTPIQLARKGDRAYFRAKTTVSSYASISTPSTGAIGTYCYFTLSKKCAAYGNIMSLIDGENRTLDELPLAKNTSSFGNLFKDCSLLTHAPRIPAKRLQQSCY